MRNYTRTMNPELERRIIHNINDRERDRLSPYATLSSDGARRISSETKADIRAFFSRDADRILHTWAYSRYIDKTQVFYCLDNDHVTHRVLHVQMVSKIGRTIGRALCLNEDLIEAMAIGHDIGHAPFGHTGEQYLSAICQDQGIGSFKHNVQSVQFLDAIEDKNLTLQVLDGILCHNGERLIQELRPDRDKGWERFDADVAAMKKTNDNPMPMTLEGCVVRYADIIAYLGRDIQDALEVGLINKDQLPIECTIGIGANNADIINSLIIDLVENSDGDDAVRFSSEIFEILRKYLDFNYQYIYKDGRVTNDHPKIKKMYETLFEEILDNVKRDPEATIFQDFLSKPWVSRSYLDNATEVEKVRDYIAGMTDRYFEIAYLKSVLPARRKDFKDNGGHE